MQIDLTKVENELGSVRNQIAALQLEEQALVAFLETARRFQVRPPKTKHKTAVAAQADRQPKKTHKRKTSSRFQPHRFPPQPIPEGYESPVRRTRLLKAIVENFEPGSIITAGAITEKIGESWPIPNNVPAKQHFSAVLLHETGPGSVLEKVGSGSWMVRPNALELLQSRVAAEIAQSQEESSRRAAAQ